MPNKFQKSVLERLEMETNQKKKPAASTVEEALETEADTPALPEIKTPAASAAPKATREASVIPDLSQFLSQEPTRQAKNKTFYLDVDVIDAIKAAAKQGKTTDSKLVNDILRKILGLTK